MYDLLLGNRNFDVMRRIDPLLSRGLSSRHLSEPVPAATRSEASGMQCPRCQHENPIGQKFCGECGIRLGQGDGTARFWTPQSEIPRHLAEKILTSKLALEGERKQVTVLFADLKGSMELMADRDPEEARKLLDPVIEHMMEAV